jgi:hypothetical protein
MTATVPTIISDEMRRCIDNCLSCHAVCEATLSYCLAHDGAHADRDGVLLLLDCAEICRTSAGFLLRGSRLHPQTCRACATICGACADWCESVSRDPVMKQSATTCRECAQSCTEMAAMG